MSDGDLGQLIRQRVAGFEAQRAEPEELRDLAVLFELDHQVRNGGFAQYLFNASCLNSFDAWFAAGEIDPVAQSLLGLAFIRIGSEYDVDLDVGRLVGHGGAALGEAYRRLLSIHSRVHGTSTDLFAAFAVFRDSLADGRDGIDGLDALNARFFDEVDIERAIVEHVRDEPSPFVK